MPAGKELGGGRRGTSTTKKNAFFSLCRKSYRDVGPLVEGPGDVYICGECIELCQSIRDVLATDAVEPEWSPRAVQAVGELRTDFEWLDDRSTHLVHDQKAGVTRWWTFAGGLANAMLAEYLAARLGLTVKHDNLTVRVAGMTTSRDFENAVREMGFELPRTGAAHVSEVALKCVKFADCVPEELVVSMLRERLSDRDSVERVIGRALVHHYR